VARGLGRAQSGPARLDLDAVEPALGLVERVADAVDLLLQHDVAAHAALERPETLVVGVLEVLEGAGEVVESGRDIGIR
jgi:hypothetical protein